MTRASATRSAAAWALYAGALMSTSALALVLRPDGAATALWWPAAGVAVAGALLLPAERRREAVAVVGTVTAATNVLTDRPLLLAALFGVANAAETAVALAVLGPRRPRLDRFADVGRLLAAAAAASLTVAGLGAVAVWAVVDGDPVLTFRTVATSHLSALVLVVPLALRHRRTPHEAGRVEVVAQTALLGTLLATIFSPGQDLPLAFLPLVALAWAGVRLPGATAVVQLVVSGLYVTMATLLGWGPFAGTAAGIDDDPFVTVGLVQAYLLVTAVVTLTLVALVEERRRTLAELQELALRDELTGLPNRRLLFDRLEQAASALQHDGGAFTVLLVDLDGFKHVNDQAGHEAGDRVLVETARRLQGVVRPGDTVARLGGDEFAVVCPGLGAGPAVDDLVRRAGTTLQQAVVTDTGVHRVRASIGVAYGTGTTRGPEVLRAADRAMYVVKQVHRRSTADAAPRLPEPRAR